MDLDEIDNDETIREPQVQRTTDGHPIPNNQVIVLIENTINVLHPKIISGLGELPNVKDDCLDDDDNLDKDNLDNNDKNENNNENAKGRGIMNFDLDHLSKEFADNDM